MTANSSPIFANDGYCVICMSPTRFVARAEWLRDNYLCSRCGTIPRQRALVEILNMVRPQWRGLTIHESSPTMIRYFGSLCPGYSCSFYLEDVQPGLESGGRRCENLEQLTFADNSFDVFITQDVMEHVFSPQNAFSEIMRVLKPGGMHLFTTPKHKRLLNTRQRAQKVNDRIEHLLEPEYHGNPVGDGRALVTWDFGADFEDLVKVWAGYLTSTIALRDRRRGIDGEYLEVFVTEKIPVNRSR